MKNLNKQILEAIHNGLSIALDNYDEYDDIQKQSYAPIKNINYTKKYLDFYNQFVDLGLPSKTLWCKYNFGSKKETKSGNYYSWGELNTKEEYNDKTYKFKSPDNTFNTIKYNKSDRKDILDLDDDVIYQNTNGIAQMPSEADFKELIKYTKITQVTNYKNSGIDGKVFKGKNGNTIFIPASGFYYNNVCDQFNQTGFLWTSTRNISNKFLNESCNFYFTSNNIGISHNMRCLGFPVRAIIKSN